MKEAAGEEMFASFQSNIAESWATFQENFEDAGLGSWADFETWLTDNGISSTTASNIRTQLEAKYASWSDFEDHILNQYTSWEDFRNDFQAGTFFRSEGVDTDGRAMAGVRIFEEPGVTREGINAPRGAIEIIGKEVHFSQSGTLRDSTPDDPINYSNLSISNTTPVPNESFDVSADVENTTSFTLPVPVSVLVDDGIEKTKTVDINGGTTRSVTFTISLEDLGNYEVTIGDLASQTVTVIPPELIT